MHRLINIAPKSTTTLLASRARTPSSLGWIRWSSRTLPSSSSIRAFKRLINRCTATSRSFSSTLLSSMDQSTSCATQSRTQKLINNCHLMVKLTSHWIRTTNRTKFRRWSWSRSCTNICWTNKTRYNSLTRLIWTSKKKILLAHRSSS